MGKKFLIVLLFVMLCWGACLVASLTNSTDEAALLALKAQVASEPSSILASNWTEETSFCDWVGVSCSLGRQRVTALNLPNMSLRGTVPKEIGNLSFLVSLNLGNNSFHGHLPLELGLLHQLKSLDLRFNELSETIPTTLAFLNNLEEMVLSYNKFSGDLPASLFNISSLVIFDLSHNRISGELPKDLCHQLPKLQLLHLSDNQLSGNLPSIHNCKGLAELNLSFNGFSGSIPSQIGNLTTLRLLGLRRNNLSGAIPVSIGNMSMLERIQLGENQILGNIPIEMGQIMNLKGLGLGRNRLTGEIPHSIFNISTLQAINLPANQLSGNLPSSLGLRLPNLQVLNIGSNEVGGIIASSISNASKLTILDLSYNSFHGKVPTTIGSLPLLEKLRLHSNKLINDPAAIELSFLSSLTNCRNLKILNIGGNPLNGILPKSIGNLSANLEKFRAASSHIKGTIPDEIGNLSNLVELYLGDNQLIGSIPQTLGQLKKIQRLRILVNLIQGRIPSSFCNLMQLGELILSGNRLSGPIPGCFGELGALRILLLNSNALTSKPPSTLWSLADINALDLSSNLLSGSLPQEIGSLRHIIELNLSNNQFTDEIPSTVGQLQGLESLDLSKNRLQGPLPSSLSDSISLEYLDLSKNELSGGIPKSLEKLRYLRYLNVSFNRLSGEIPAGGPFKNFTLQSFLQNDGLCGDPHFHVGPCNHRESKHRLKYIVPPLASVAIVAALVIGLLSLKNKSKQLPIQDDPPLGVTWRRISYQEILHATNHFSEENLIGKGSTGPVYKGVFFNKLVAAVKVFDLELQSAFKRFDAECEIMSNIRHRNLVKIISSCSSIDFKALVLEYMPNGNLEMWLYSHSCILNLVQRLSIMIDVASALEYLHSGYSTPVLHCDLKPGNILLDEDMVAHLADFGIAKLLKENESATQTNTLGTIGYMAPEYGSAGVLSTMVDVYSYGILLMEIFTRKKPTDDIFLGELSLKQWVCESFPDAAMEVVDANLLREERDNISALQNCIISLFRLAMECTAHFPEQRINMTDVVVMLKKIKTRFHENALGP